MADNVKWKLYLGLVDREIAIRKLFTLIGIKKKRKFIKEINFTEFSELLIQIKYGHHNNQIIFITLFVLVIFS